MTASSLIVVGAGGFGREVLDVIDAINASQTAPQWRVFGVLDDAPTSKNLERLADRSTPYLGSLRSYRFNVAPMHVVVGIGSPDARRRVVDTLRTSADVAYPILVHPRAYVGSRAELAPGTVVCAGVQVSTNVRTGIHAHLNSNATVGHDSILADYVSVNPGAVISGECEIGSGSVVGAGAVVLQRLRVGSHVTVGAAACVVSDVCPDTVVKGVPAR